MTSNELNLLGIREWDWISEKYEKPNLLLGNGFSLNIADQFNYRSLFETFIKNADPKFSQLFRQFGTSNFEIIQEHLSHTSKVNHIFDLETREILNALEDLKNGLIKTINEVHPRFKEIQNDQIDKLTKQFVEEFGDVYTLNYDMFLYHLIMRSVDYYNEGTYKQAYQDYFWGSMEGDSKEFVPFQTFKFYKHIYYLHGALCFFKSDLVDYKILRKPDVEIIDVIETQIKQGNFPLFVSEGNSPDKLKSIGRSNYLTFCLRKLKKDNAPLLVYGTSLAENDKHIRDAIKDNRRDLIIAIYVGDKSEATLNKEVATFREIFDRKNNSLDFVNSNSVFQF